MSGDELGLTRRVYEFEVPDATRHNHTSEAKPGDAGDHFLWSRELDAMLMNQSEKHPDPIQYANSRGERAGLCA